MIFLVVEHEKLYDPYSFARDERGPCGAISMLRVDHVPHVLKLQILLRPMKEFRNRLEQLLDEVELLMEAAQKQR